MKRPPAIPSIKSDSNIPSTPASLAKFHSRLFAWFDVHKRALPWRSDTPDPYRVWVSEVMLQQTQVRTVIPYFNRFVAEFPSVARLASAPIDEVLRVWAGLGYYRRARHLHEAAKMIGRDFGGQIPARVEGLRRLPGVGRYTAGAIASIAFGEPAAAVDGNIRRVLARLSFSVACRRRLADPLADKAAWALAESLVPAKRPGDFNQALMELGATVCVPASPCCGECPIRHWCGACAAGVQDRVPPSKTGLKTKAITLVAVVIRGGRGVLFERRSANGLWGGLWDVPCATVASGDDIESVAAGLVARAGFGAARMTRAGHVSARLTHRAVTAHVFVAERPRGRARTSPTRRWMTPDDLPVGTSRLTQRILALADSASTSLRVRA